MRGLGRVAAWSACLLSVAALGCGKVGEVVELDVYAAASLREALQELAPLAERELGVRPVFNFGSSGDLSKQIVAAGKADVFLSADEKDMDELEAAGMLLAGTRRSLWTNVLVVIEPKDGTSFKEPFAPAQLHQPAIRQLALANTESVPAGRYAKAWLESCGEWERVRARVVPAIDVRAALATVESGAAQAGIVYQTDAALSQRVRVVHVVPAAEGPRISYPVAALAGRPRLAEARRLLEFLGSPTARAVFERAGFAYLDGATRR